MEIVKDNGFIALLDIHMGKKCGIRLDNIDEAIVDKLNQVLQMCLEKNYRTVLTAGDIFDGVNIQRPAFLNVWKAFNKFRRLGITVYVLWGNHDMYRGNPELKNETPLQVLIETEVVKEYPKDYLRITNGKESIDVKAFDYYDEITPYTGDLENSMLIAHTFYENEFMGGKDHNLTASDIDRLGYKTVVLGHDHSYYPPVTTKGNNTIFRFGSLTRVSTTPGELQRRIRVMDFHLDGSYHMEELEVKKLEDIAKAETQKLEVKSIDYSSIVKEIQSSNVENEDNVLVLINKVENENIKKIILENI